jgi:hypothetical protein
MRLRTGTCHGPPREFWLPSFERWGRDFIEIAMWWTSNTVLDTLYHMNLQPSAFAGGCFALASIPMDLNWINWVFTDFTGSVPKSAAFPVAFRKLSFIGRKQDRRERRGPQWTVEPGTQVQLTTWWRFLGNLHGAIRWFMMVYHGLSPCGPMKSYKKVMMYNMSLILRHTVTSLASGGAKAKRGGGDSVWLCLCEWF